MENATIGDELRNIVDHAEALLGALGDDGDARLGVLRERVAGSIDAARARLDELASDAQRPLERATAALERWVSDNPWAAVATGAGIGFMIGVLLSRRGAPPASRHASGSS